MHEVHRENGSRIRPLSRWKRDLFTSWDGSLLARRTLPHSTFFCVEKKEAHIYCSFRLCMDRKTRKKAAVSKRHFVPSKKGGGGRRSNDIGYIERYLSLAGSRPGEGLWAHYKTCIIHLQMQFASFSSFPRRITGVSAVPEVQIGISASLLSFMPCPYFNVACIFNPFEWIQWQCLQLMKRINHVFFFLDPCVSSFSPFVAGHVSKFRQHNCCIDS